MGTTAIWGWTFVVVRDAVRVYPVLPFLGVRFALAALVLAPTFLRAGHGVREGLLPGIVLGASYWAQTTGLQFTTPSRAGLLTGLFVVLTPILLFAVTGRRPALVTVGSTVVALVGTVLLTGLAGGTTRHEAIGDGLEALTALLLSVHILLLSRVRAEADPFRVAWSQMAVMAVLFTLGSVARGEIIAPPPAVWAAILLTGMLASAAAFTIQTFAQQQIAPNRVALILVSEPAFATLFGVMLAGDTFSTGAGIGAALIFLGLLVHELSPVPASSRRDGTGRDLYAEDTRRVSGAP